MYIEIIDQETVRYPVDVAAETGFRIPNNWPGGIILNRTFARVIETLKPSHNPLTEIVVEGTPEFIEGEWRQTWVVEQVNVGTAEANLIASRNEKWEAIKAERDHRTIHGGFKVTIDGVDKWFHSDTFSRTQQIGLVLLGTNIPPDLLWKTMDGSFVTMTPILAAQIFQAAAASDTALYAYAEQLRAAVFSAEDPNSVDILAGWPPVFA